MKLTTIQKGLTDYDFLKLYSYLLVKNNQVIIKKHELQRELFYIYETRKYNKMFEDIIAKRDVINNNSHMDLTQAFNSAWTFGSLIKISDSSSDIKSIIPFTKPEVEELLTNYKYAYITDMQSIVEQVEGNKQRRIKK